MEKERKYQQSYVTPCYEINLEQFHENCDAVMQPFEKHGMEMWHTVTR